VPQDRKTLTFLALSVRTALMSLGCSMARSMVGNSGSTSRGYSRGARWRVEEPGFDRESPGELPSFSVSMPRNLSTGPLIGFPRVRMLTQWLRRPLARLLRVMRDKYAVSRDSIVAARPHASDVLRRDRGLCQRCRGDPQFRGWTEEPQEVPGRSACTHRRRRQLGEFDAIVAARESRQPVSYRLIIPQDNRVRYRVRLLL
jgi:hypothetical protein